MPGIVTFRSSVARVGPGIRAALPEAGIVTPG
jgi:hypothetical protein